MNNLTRKTSKKGLVEYIKENMGKVMEDKRMKILADQITYTMNKFKEKSTLVDKDTLFNLVTDMRVQLGEQVNIFDLVKENEPLPIENSVKVVQDKKDTEIKMEEVSVDSLVDNIFDTTKEVKTKSKKTITEKVKESAKEHAEKETKKETKKITKLVKAKPTVNNKQIELAESFPREFEVEGMGKLRVITDKLTMADIYKRVVDGSKLVFAMYWSHRNLKQYKYDIHDINSTLFTEFPNDLDVTQLIHVSDESKVAYCLSAYSEIIYTIVPKDLVFEDGMRFSSGIEYNIYEIIE